MEQEEEGKEEEQSRFIVTLSETLLPGRKMKATLHRFDLPSPPTRRSRFSLPASDATKNNRGGDNKDDDDDNGAVHDSSNNFFFSDQNCSSTTELTSFPVAASLVRASWAVAVSSNVVAVSSYHDGCHAFVEFLNATSGKSIKRMEFDTGAGKVNDSSRLRTVALSPRFAAVGDDCGLVRFFDSTTRFSLHSVYNMQSTPVVSLRFSGGCSGCSGCSSAPLLVCAGERAHVMLIDMNVVQDQKKINNTASSSHKKVDGDSASHNNIGAALRIAHHDASSQTIAAELSSDGRTLVVANHRTITFFQQQQQQQQRGDCEQKRKEADHSAMNSASTEVEEVSNQWGEVHRTIIGKIKQFEHNEQLIEDIRVTPTVVIVSTYQKNLLFISLLAPSVVFHQPSSHYYCPIVVDVTNRPSPMLNAAAIDVGSVRDDAVTTSTSDGVASKSVRAFAAASASSARGRGRGRGSKGGAAAVNAGINNHCENVALASSSIEQQPTTSAAPPAGGAGNSSNRCHQRVYQSLLTGKIVKDAQWMPRWGPAAFRGCSADGIFVFSTVKRLIVAHQSAHQQ